MHFSNKYSLAASVTTCVLLLIVLLFTNPVSSGPVAIASMLVAVFLFIYSFVLLVTAVLPRRVAGGIIQTRASRYYSALVVSAGCVYILGLASIGQLELIDVALVAVLEIVAIFYILRRS